MGKTKVVAAGFHHRSTLKQVNKPFKGTKNKVKGRIEVHSSKPANVSTEKFRKANRTNAAVIKRGKKKEKAQESIRVSTARNVPRLVAVIPFHPSVDLHLFKTAIIRYLLQSLVDQSKISALEADMAFVEQNKYGSTRRIVTLGLPTWAGVTHCRKIQFVFCHLAPETSDVMKDPSMKFEQTCAILDICKGADIILGLFGSSSSDEHPFSEYGAELKRLICQQGLSWVVGASVPYTGESPAGLTAAKRRAQVADFARRGFFTEFGKGKGGCFDLQEAVPRMAAGETSAMSEKEKGEMNHFIRHIASATLPELAWRSTNRGYLLSESVVVNPDSLTMVIEGHCRGVGFSTRYPVHITGVGDFPLTEVWAHPGRTETGHQFQSKQPELIAFLSEEEKARFDQVWAPLLEYDEVNIGEGEKEANLSEQCVSEEMESNEMQDSDEDDDPDWYQEKTENAAQFVNRNPRVSLRKRWEMEFDDEVDTPIDIPARDRFAKYRGLKSLQNTSWIDLPNEILPDYYGNIYNLKPFSASAKRIQQLYHEVVGDKRASYVRLVLRIPDVETLTTLTRRATAEAQEWNPLLVSSLLPVEKKYSVNHYLVERDPAAGTAPVPSKALYYVQCGFRRFIGRPLFSKLLKKDAAAGLPVDAGNPSIHKLVYRRYLPLRDRKNYVASLAGPIQSDKAPVIMWMYKACSEKQQRELDGKYLFDEVDAAAAFTPVAHGTFVTADPDRLIIKRILLTGYPHKMKKKKCSIRRMFFNAQDVEYFRPVALSTASGKEGKIKEPLGTHGDMKCIFSDVLGHNETVRLPLYKRVVPPFVAPSNLLAQ